MHKRPGWYGEGRRHAIAARKKHRKGKTSAFLQLDEHKLPETGLRHKRGPLDIEVKVGKEGVTGEVKATKKIMGKQIGVYAKHNFITKEMNGGVVAGKMRIISNPRAAIHAAKITVLFVKKKKSVNGR